MFSVQKKGYVDLQSVSWDDSLSCCYGATLPKDTTFNVPCSWSEADPTSFLIRGQTYLHDHKKVALCRTILRRILAYSHTFVSKEKRLFLALWLPSLVIWLLCFLINATTYSLRFFFVGFFHNPILDQGERHVDADGWSRLDKI